MGRAAREQRWRDSERKTAEDVIAAVRKAYRQVSWWRRLVWAVRGRLI